MRPTRSRAGKRWRYGTAAVAILTLGAATACTSSGSPSSSSTASGSSASASASSGGTLSFPRNETVYTSGTAGGPPTIWNPLDTGNFATGAQGLIYEPLFLYDPIKGQYDPWLATGSVESGWQGTKYVINVRSGVKWSDGTPMTAADVAFSINLAMKNAADPYNANVASVASATASGNTVTVTFKNNQPAYTEFTDYLWKAPVLPQHIWSKVPASQLATWADTNPVGTGPMTVDTTTQTEVAYQTKPAGQWWANSALGLSFKFKYLVDVVNGTNSQELGQLTTGQIDWDNNYLPGINALAQAQGGTGGYTLKFFQSESQHYMMSGNTVWLEPNTTKAPMNNVDFRKALAYALNPSAIAQQVYGGIATPANPTGLLPTLQSQFVTPNDSQLTPLEATYNPSKAEALLKQSTYKGQTLTLEAPAGWSDWNQAQTVIAQELEAVGIKINVIQPTANQRTADLDSGKYDLALDNNAGLDTTPWSYFQRIYQLPIQSQQNAQMNWERFSSPSDWATVQQLATTAPSDTATQNADYLKLEKDFLTQQPEIPLWYNGVWFQGNTQYWTDYPSASSSADANVPAMWGGYIGAMTTVPALAQLTPVKQSS
ncbi:MAG TPA: ABC transporter substrate-binding protein [Trebonia sp.]